MSAEIWTIVVAGGSGQRFGAAKQFVSLQGRAVIGWAIDAARPVSTGIVAVVPQASDGGMDATFEGVVVVAGGATRAASVRAGLSAVPASAEIIVVHDAARPLASSALFRAVVEAIEQGADGAIPGLSIPDTIKRVELGRVVDTIDRVGLVAVQTPQAFSAEVLRRAHLGDPDATDDAGLLERIGATVAVVAGEATNVKLTSVTDLALLAFLSGQPTSQRLSPSASEAVRA